MNTKQLAFKSMRLFPDQIRHALQDAESLEFADAYKNAENVVIGGMGGSMFSYHVISSLYIDRFTKPFLAANDYRLPSFISNKTVFIGSSYSGTTEEAIQTTEKAFEIGANVTGITEGGPLQELLQSRSVPFYHINPTHNPSGQPRMAVGYMIFGTVQLLTKLGAVKVNTDEIINAVASLEGENDKLASDAQHFAQVLDSGGIIYVAAEHLSGAAHVVRNQTNESAKTFAEYNLVPELNHHFMEGLTYPKDKNITFIFYNSSLYSERVQKRMKLTKEVIEKQGVSVKEVKIPAGNTTEQLMKYLQFGSYLTYYLAEKNNVDPSGVPWVDYFKEKLAS